jgi:hypothetical protein
MHLWIAGFTVLTFVVGLLMCGLGAATAAGVAYDSLSVNVEYPVSEIVLDVATGLVMVGLGLGLVALSGFALWRTAFGARFATLRTVDRTVAVLAAIPGLIAAGVATAGCACVAVPIIIAISSASAAIEREERVREIEEGVRRGLRH